MQSSTANRPLMVGDIMRFKRADADVVYLGAGYSKFVFYGRVLRSNSPLHRCGEEANSWVISDFDRVNENVDESVTDEEWLRLWCEHNPQVVARVYADLLVFMYAGDGKIIDPADSFPSGSDVIDAARPPRSASFHSLLVALQTKREYLEGSSE